MARNESLPFQRGQTYYGGTVPKNSDGTTNYSAHSDLEGKTFVIEDQNYADSGGVKSNRTGKYIVLMIVRAKAAAAANLTAPAKLLAKMKTDDTGSGTPWDKVSGFAFSGRVVSTNPTIGDLCYPVDEFLTGDVVDGDLFYVVIAGPAMVLTDTAGTTTIAVGARVVPGAGTAGRVVAQDTNPVAGTATFNQVNGAVGIAIMGDNKGSGGNATAGVTQSLLIDVIPKTSWA